MVRLVANNVYLNQKESFIFQLLYVIRGNLDSDIFRFIKGPFIAWQLNQ